jgi:hypothetical protein
VFVLNLGPWSLIEYCCNKLGAFDYAEVEGEMLDPGGVDVDSAG